VSCKQYLLAQVLSISDQVNCGKEVEQSHVSVCGSLFGPWIDT
jgi:hypothetical protein